MTITEFLEARIAEDEEEADWYGNTEHFEGGWTNEHTARALKDCAAKRAIIGMHRRDSDVQHMVYGDIYPCTECGDVDASPVEFPCPTIKTLAAVYSDHPDHQQDWKP